MFFKKEKLKSLCITQKIGKNIFDLYAVKKTIKTAKFQSVLEIIVLQVETLRKMQIHNFINDKYCA